MDNHRDKISEAKLQELNKILDFAKIRTGSADLPIWAQMWQQEFQDLVFAGDLVGMLKKLRDSIDLVIRAIEGDEKARQILDQRRR